MMEFPEGIELVDFKGSVLKMEPGDILLIRAPGMISSEIAQRIKSLVESYGLKCMVLGDGLSVQLLRPPKNQLADAH